MPDEHHVVSNLHGVLAGPFPTRQEAKDWAANNAVPIMPKSNPGTGAFVAKNYGKPK